MRLRIFIGEDDRYHGRPLYEEIVVHAQNSRLSGATVFKGHLGYGASSGLHAAKLLRRSKDLPIVIEILDTEAKVTAFLDTLDTLLKSGVVTMERVDMYIYSTAQVAVASADDD